MGHGVVVSPGLFAQEDPAVLVVVAAAVDCELVQSPEVAVAAEAAVTKLVVLVAGLDIQTQQHLGPAILTGKTDPVIRFFCLADRWLLVVLARAKCRVLGPAPVQGLAGPVPRRRVSRQVSSRRRVGPWWA